MTDATDPIGRPTVPRPVAEKVAEIQEEKDFGSAGEVYRYVFMEAGYNV